MPMFIQSIFSFRKFSKFTIIFVAGGIGWVSFILTADPESRQLLFPVFQGCLLLTFCYVFFMLFVAIKERKPGATSLSIGVTFCFGVVFLEMLRTNPYTKLEINGPNFINVGLIFFLFVLSNVLSSMYFESYKQNIRLNETLDNQVLERTKELSAANAIKERIIRIISHDLRTPLINLNSLIAVNEKEVESDHMLSYSFKNIRQKIDDTTNMLDDLLAWERSSTDTGHFKLFLERIDIANLINQNTKEYLELGKEKNINVFSAIKPGIYIKSDHNMLKVVLRNLISNAIKFSHKNSSVYINAKHNGQMTDIYVIDEGLGVPESMKESIFEMNPKNNRAGTNNEKSTGIGLGLVKDLIHQNNGTIKVLDNPNGKGSTFLFSIPRWFES